MHAVAVEFDFVEPLRPGTADADTRQSMGLQLHCLCAAPHQEIGLTAMQGRYNIIQLFRFQG
jgi:hypothetical protein